MQSRFQFLAASVVSLLEKYPWYVNFPFEKFYTPEVFAPELVKVLAVELYRKSLLIA